MWSVGLSTLLQKMNISSTSLLKCWSCYTSQLCFLCYVHVSWCFI